MAKATDWYKDLEGKEITFINHFGERYKGKVTGFDYYLGCTIQNEKHYLYCYRGPMFPLKRQAPTFRAKLNKKHRQSIAALAKGIRSGCLDFREIIRKVNKGFNRNPNAASCPFSQ